LNQKQKGPGDPPWGSQKQEEVKVKPAPMAFDPHEAMRMAGAEDLTDEEVQAGGKDQTEDEAQAAARAERRRRRRALCCCRVPGCGIGPMTEVEEYDE